MGVVEKLHAQSASVPEIIEQLIQTHELLSEAMPDGDPYHWTHDYGRWGSVDLIAPPGEPRHWAGGVIRRDEPPAWTGIIVDMWTAQEGPSDLSLEAELVAGPDGAPTLRFDNLHVM